MEDKLEFNAVITVEFIATRACAMSIFGPPEFVEAVIKIPQSVVKDCYIGDGTLYRVVLEKIDLHNPQEV